MAVWSRDKVNSSEINSGQEYTNNDNFSLTAMNAIVNGALYTQDFAEHLADTPDNSDIDGMGEPSVTLIDNVVDGKTYKKFKFSNFTGLRGATGAPALVSNVTLSSESEPRATFSLSFSRFNRTPIVGDTAIFICKNTATEQSFIALYEITSVGESTASGSRITSVETTGATGADGANGVGGKELSKGRLVGEVAPYIWYSKTWGGLTSFLGENIWSYNGDIYYSEGASQYILNRDTSAWEAKTWSGLTSFSGRAIWTNGETVYYSSGTSQYALNSVTGTWEAKTWSGLTSFFGSSVWTDGEYIYYSSGTSQYVLNRSTSTWEAKTWTIDNDNLFTGGGIWTDGGNIYCSNGTSHYVLDRTTSTWTAKTWGGVEDFVGQDVWSDGENIYLGKTHVLDRNTSTWIAKTWIGFVAPCLSGNVWSDGEDVYYSAFGSNYVLQRVIKNVKLVDSDKANSSQTSEQAQALSSSQITASDDLNNFYGEDYWGKMFYCADNEEPINAPISASGGSVFIYRNGSGSTVQEYTSNVALSDTNLPTKWIRARAYSGTWNAWEEVATSMGKYEYMSVGKATEATKATQDGNGNVINTTYATKAETNAKYTKPVSGIPETDLSSTLRGTIDNLKMAIPAGGASGEVLVKISNSDYDTEWANITSPSGGSQHYQHNINIQATDGTGLCIQLVLINTLSTAMSKSDVLTWKTGKGNIGTPMSNAQAFVYKPTENIFKSTTYVEWEGTSWQDFKVVFAADDVMNLNWQNCVVSDTLWSTDGYGD